MNSYKERALVEKAKQGDQEALSLLWDIITPRLFGYLINTTKDKALAEDLLQTTWLNVIEALPTFRYRGTGVSAWIFAIARNELRQHWRKSNKEVAFDPLLHDKTVENKTSVDNKILADQILASLSEDDRELLQLRYIADLPLSDIAKILKINFVTVRVRIHRLLRKIQSSFNPNI